MKNIDAILNEFLIQQNYDDELVARYEKDSDSYYLEYNPDDVEMRSLVVLGGKSNLRADELFMKYCKELGLKIDVHVETMSFLHEIGHHWTMNFLDENELLESEITKLCLYIQDEENDETFMKYFTCPVEYEATIDAINFCNACPEIILELDKKLQKVLYEEA